MEGGGAAGASGTKSGYQKRLAAAQSSHMALTWQTGNQAVQKGTLGAGQARPLLAGAFCALKGEGDGTSGDGTRRHAAWEGHAEVRKKDRKRN